MYLSKKIGNDSIRKDSAFWQGDDGINAGQSWLQGCLEAEKTKRNRK